MRILILKTDRAGDFLNISPVLKNIVLNHPNSKIDLVCSEYNFQIAKYYSCINNFFFYQKSLVYFLFNNYKILFNNYDLILQLDGKNWSYKLAALLRSPSKGALQYEKNKKIFKTYFKIFRPFFLSPFFNHLVICKEDYKDINNKNFHYLSLYLDLLKSFNFKITDTAHYFPYVPSSNDIVANLPEKYVLFHFGKRWENFLNKEILLALKNKIIEISINTKCIITSDQDNYLLGEFLNLSKNINIIKNLDMKHIIYLVKNCSSVISSHSGLIVHSAACFQKNIIDIVPEVSFDELDRWVPLGSKYSRFSLSQIRKISL